MRQGAWALVTLVDGEECQRRFSRPPPALGQRVVSAGRTIFFPEPRYLHAACHNLPCQPGVISWLNDGTHLDPAISPGCSPRSTTCPTTRPKSMRLSMPG